MIKGINYRPTCQADILYWIMRFEEITLKRINTLSYLNLKKKEEESVWIQIRNETHRRIDMEN